MNERPIPHSRPWIEDDDRAAVDVALREGMIACGGRVQAFENAIASYLGASGGVACNSGTAALVLALRAIGVHAGDEVILPTYVCSNVLAAICSLNAIPRVCDVDQTGVVTTDTVHKVISSRSRAIIAVHIFGHPCDVPSLEKLGLPIIEDACQAFGLETSGRRAGLAGTIGVFSFHATKCLATGEGGMLVASDSRWLDRARALASTSSFENVTGVTSMSDIQAALGLSQIKRYSLFLERRTKMIAAYNQICSDLQDAQPSYPEGAKFLYRYTIRTTQEFEKIQSLFLDRGVHVRRGVDQLLHRRIGINDYYFPVATRLYESVVSLPFYPSLSLDEQAHVLRATQEVFGAY